MLYLFSNHYTFYLSYLGMNYTNVIGFILFIVFVLQFISGLLLSCYYTPMIAFSSVYYIMIDVNYGWFIRYIHVLGASMFMIFIIFHWLRGIWYRLSLLDQFEFIILSLRNNKGNLIWVSGVVILLCTFLTSFIGYCLCFGQMSYWGITVMINILTIFPWIGHYIGQYLWCSSMLIVNRLFVLHFLMGFVIGLLIIVHLLFLHNYSSCNPLVNNQSSYVFSFSLLFFKDMFISFVIAALIALFLFYDPDIFGNADNLVPANPLATPTHILPEWYFNIYYAILRAFPNKLLGVIVTATTMLCVFSL